MKNLKIASKPQSSGLAYRAMVLICINASKNAVGFLLLLHKIDQCHSSPPFFFAVLRMYALLHQTFVDLLYLTAIDFQKCRLRIVPAT